MGLILSNGRDVRLVILTGRFVIEQVYEILFYKISQFHKTQDTDLSMLFSKALYLDPAGLGVPFELSMNLLDAVTVSLLNVITQLGTQIITHSQDTI